jgi:hypothetical protein
MALAVFPIANVIVENKGPEGLGRKTFKKEAHKIVSQQE